MRRGYRGGAKKTTLSSDITNVSTSLSGADFSTWAGISTNGPFQFVIDRGQAAEEKVLATTLAGNTISGMTRGYDGTAAVGHTAGANIEHIGTAVDDDEANAHINDVALDHHTQYAKKTGAAFTGAVTNTSTDSATAQIATGLTGAIAATRYVGGTATAAPTTGTFAVGDFVIDQTGKIWVCTVAGTPGTWVQVGGAASAFVGAFAYRETALSIADVTGVAVTFGAEEYDTDAIHDNATNPSRFTVPAGKGGKYRLTATVRWAANATGYRRLEFKKNGVDVNLAVQAPGMTGTYISQVHTRTIDLAAADYVEVQVTQNSGGALNVDFANMSIEKLG